MLLAASCTVIGVVIAATGNENETITIDSSELIQNIDNEITHQQTNTQSSSIQLKLPIPAGKNKPGIKELQQLIEAEVNSIEPPLTEPVWQTLKVKRGDSLSALFDKAKVKPSQLIELMKLGPATDELRRLHPGDTVKIISDDEGQLLSLNYQIDTVRYLQVDRKGEDLNAGIHKHHIEVRTAYASAEIQSSLFLASADAGLSQSLTMELANIFGWDIDFALDIRRGDQFTVIYEQRYKNGNKIKEGNILAAEFINQGKTHRALRYKDPVSGNTGYYSPTGHSLRKAFLRSPVNFSSISSRFTTSRYHPILHKLRSHKGVDYAARRGTPIRASGDGRLFTKVLKAATERQLY